MAWVSIIQRSRWLRATAFRIFCSSVNKHIDILAYFGPSNGLKWCRRTYQEPFPMEEHWSTSYFRSSHGRLGIEPNIIKLFQQLWPCDAPKPPRRRSAWHVDPSHAFDQSVTCLELLLNASELSMRRTVEPVKATSTLQDSWKNMKDWFSKCDEGYWRFWRLDRSPVSIFPLPDQFLRADYFTYFERHNCSSESAEFNASEIMKKYEDLI